MNFIEPRTPFPTTGYFGPEYFCDREKELEQLRINIEGGNSYYGLYDILFRRWVQRLNPHKK